MMKHLFSAFVVMAMASHIGDSRATDSMAPNSSYLDGKGNEYTASINQHGAVLRSDRIAIYLGRTCDAYSPQYGTGSWGWANGGFLVTFKSLTIGFPHQEIEAGNQHKCEL